VTAVAGPAPAVQAARPGLDAIWVRLAPHLSGVYANFLASATEADVAAIYPAGTRRRLKAIKAQYDPGNLFAGNHNIRPSAGADPARAVGDQHGHRDPAVGVDRTAGPLVRD
jgi:Berberine and berberine like